jgi:hypothetical protein
MEMAPAFLFAYITGSIMCSAFVAVLALTSAEFSGAKLPVVLDTIGYVIVFFGPPYAAISALVMSHFFKYTVTADGVQGQDYMGRPSFVPWDAVAEMKPISIGNLDFVRVIGHDGARTVWLPMFVRHAAGDGAADVQRSPQFQALQSFGLRMPLATRA